MHLPQRPPLLPIKQHSLLLQSWNREHFFTGGRVGGVVFGVITGRQLPLVHFNPVLQSLSLSQILLGSHIPHVFLHELEDFRQHSNVWHWLAITHGSSGGGGGSR